MSIRSIHRFAIVGFAVSLSGLAFARNPPALVQAQQGSEHASKASGGYRDITRRFGVVPARSPEVLVQGAGYRDILQRFPAAARTAASPLSASIDGQTGLR